MSLMALNQTTEYSYTVSLIVGFSSVQHERSGAKSKASGLVRSLLFDFAADAATLRANG